MEEAGATVERFRELMPGFRMSGWQWIDNYKNANDRKRLHDAAVLAGVPE